MSVNKTPRGEMNRDRYAELKSILEERRREIMSAVHEKIRDVRSEGANSPTHGVLDAAETSEADIQDDIEFALIQMKAETLSKIEEALRRLEEGTFGYCFECGEEISERRLRALPFAVRCKDCEEAREVAQQRERVISQRRGSAVALHGHAGLTQGPGRSPARPRHSRGGLPSSASRRRATFRRLEPGATAPPGDGACGPPPQLKIGSLPGRHSRRIAHERSGRADRRRRWSVGERPLVIPAELPVLPLRDTVLFPNSFMPLAVAREASVRLIDEATSSGRMIGVFTQREASVEEPVQDDLYPIGTATHIHKMFKLPDGSLRLIVQGLARVRLDRITQTRPYLKAAVTARRRAAARRGSPRDRRPPAQHQEQLPAGRLAVAAAVRRSAGARRQHHRPGQARRLHRLEPRPPSARAIKQEVLETLDIRARMDALNRILIKELEVLELGSKIQSQVQSEVGKNQREYFLREQLKAIQKELGEGDDQAKEIDELRSKIESDRHARRGQEGSAARARSAVEDAGRRRGIHRCRAPTSTGSSRCRGRSAPRTPSI